MQSRPGTEIHDIIRRANRVFIVLDDNHRVAEVAQALQRVEQAMIVALMQPNARFVEHIQHADQTRADLRCQPNPLRLAARQCIALAVQGKVRQADVLQKRQPRAHFLHDFARDSLFKFRQPQRSEEDHGFLDAHARHVDDGFAADRDRQALRAEPRPLAVGALHPDHELLQAEPS